MGSFSKGMIYRRGSLSVLEGVPRVIRKWGVREEAAVRQAIRVRVVVGLPLRLSR